MHQPPRRWLHTVLSVLAFAITTTATASATRTTASVPPEYIRVVPNDTVVTGFIPDTQAFWISFAKSLEVSMADFDNDPPPNLFFMNLGELAETKQKLSANVPVVFWVSKLPLSDGPGDPLWGMAFELPGATAANTTAKSSSGMDLHFVDDLVIATSKGSSYTTADTGANELTASVPDAPFACAIAGSMFKQLATTAKPMMGMGPMMMQGSLMDMTKSLSPGDRQDAQRVMQTAIDDVMNMAHGAVNSLENIKVATVEVDPGDFLVDLNFKIDGSVDPDHGVASKIVKSLTAGNAMYYAIDEPTLEWMTGMEADMLAAALAMSGTPMAKVKGLASLGPAMSSVLKEMQGGIAGGVHSDFQEDDFFIGTRNPANLLKSMGSLMTDMNGLDIGLGYKKVSAGRWDIDLNLMDLFGGASGNPEMSKAMKDVPQKFDLFMKPGDGMITGMRRVAGSKTKKTPGSPTNLADFKRHADSRIIFGLGFDLNEMAEGMKSLGQAMSNVAGQPGMWPDTGDEPAPFTFIFHAPADDELAMFIRIPSAPMAEQVKMRLKQQGNSGS